jgi:hypothetical protein
VASKPRKPVATAAAKEEFGFEGSGSSSSATSSPGVARAASTGGGGSSGGGGSTGSAPKGPTGEEFGFEGG